MQIQVTIATAAKAQKSNRKPKQGQRKAPGAEGDYITNISKETTRFLCRAT